MQKILFTIMGLEVSSYSFFTVLASLIVLVGTYLYAIKRGFDKRLLLFSLAAMTVGAFLGARLLHVVTNFNLYQQQPWRLFSFDFIGFAIYGGVLGAILTAILCAKLLKFSIWKLGDVTAPFLGFGIVSMRIGCYLNGCCFGRETDLPWGVTFPFFSYAHNYQLSKDISHMFSVSPVHPTQLYELIFALLGSLLAIYILRRRLNDGMAILAFGLWYTVFRLVNYFFRVPSSTFEAPVYFYPVLYLLMIFIISILIVNRYKNTK